MGFIPFLKLHRGDRRRQWQTVLYCNVPRVKRQVFGEGNSFVGQGDNPGGFTCNVISLK